MECIRTSLSRGTRPSRQSARPSPRSRNAPDPNNVPPPDGYYNVTFQAGGFPEECKDEEGHHTVPGSWIAMPPPLTDGEVEFADGSRNDVEAMSHDVSAFLMWSAEPHLNDRKQAGPTGVLFLAVVSVLLYLTNKRVWAPVKAGGRPLGADQH